VSREEKIHFLNGLHVMSVPAVYQEPKGLYILEALANGVPVVQPSHGAFPELLELTGGGLLVKPHSASALAEGLHSLYANPKLREELGQKGKEVVHDRFGDKDMAQATLQVYARYAPLTQKPSETTMRTIAG
jgi:glycosyltransferase involved in cell wall biosynthesis